LNADDVNFHNVQTVLFQPVYSRCTPVLCTHTHNSGFYRKLASDFSLQLKHGVVLLLLLWLNCYVLYALYAGFLQILTDLLLGSKQFSIWMWGIHKNGSHLSTDVFVLNISIRTISGGIAVWSCWSHMQCQQCSTLHMWIVLFVILCANKRSTDILSCLFVQRSNDAFTIYLTRILVSGEYHKI